MKRAEVIKANTSLDKVSNKKFDSMLEAQRPSSLKAGLGYTEESSSSDLKI